MQRESARTTAGVDAVWQTERVPDSAVRAIVAAGDSLNRAAAPHRADSTVRRTDTAAVRTTVDTTRHGQP